MDQKDIVNENCFRYDTTSDGKPNPKIMEAIKNILIEIGEDPSRPGLKRTPLRVARAYSEWFGGYGKKPEDVLNRTFPSEGYDDMVVIKDISGHSFCEHHMADVRFLAHIGVVYDKSITGLDKFVKLVEIYGSRLQTQEVMTQQIGEAIKKVLKPKAIMVIVEGKHSCVSSRETRNQSMSFTTTYRYGLFKSEPNLEARFLQYISRKPEW